MKKDIINKEHSSQGLKSISTQMEMVVQKLLGNHGLVEIDILKNWPSIVGEDLAKYTLPEKIDFKKDQRENGTLFLIVSNGAFALEIQHKMSLILEKINTYFGYKAVSQLKIFQNEALFSSQSKSILDDNDKKKLVSKTKQTYIDDMLKDIDNPDLKDHLEKIAQSIFEKKEK